MANVHHPHLLKHPRYRQIGQLKASLGRHAMAWSVAAFLAIAAVLAVLFVWLQVLPEQATMSVNTPGSRAPAAQPLWQVSQKDLPDPFLEQKKSARQANLPDQF